MIDTAPPVLSIADVIELLPALRSQTVLIQASDDDADEIRQRIKEAVARHDDILYAPSPFVLAKDLVENSPSQSASIIEIATFGRLQCFNTGTSVVIVASKSELEATRLPSAVTNKCTALYARP